MFNNKGIFLPLTFGDVQKTRGGEWSLGKEGTDRELSPHSAQGTSDLTGWRWSRGGHQCSGFTDEETKDYPVGKCRQPHQSWPLLTLEGQPGKRERSRGSWLKTPLSESFPFPLLASGGGQPIPQQGPVQTAPTPILLILPPQHFTSQRWMPLWSIWFCSND